MRKKYVGIDIFKFIMSIFVVAIHTHPFENCNNIIFMKIYSRVVKMAVPFFFIATGFFVFNKVNKENSNSEKLKIIKENFVKILKMYITWTIIFLPITIFDFVRKNDSVLFALLKFVRGVLFVGENFDSFPLWYLLSTFYSLVLIYILIKKNVSFEKIVYISMGIWLFGNIVTFLDNSEINLPIIISIIEKIIVLVFSNGRIFTGIGYIVIRSAFGSEKQILYQKN